MDSKKCTKCGEIKPKTEFYTRKNRPSGVRPSCKKCEISNRIDYQRSLVGLVSRIYSNQRRNCRYRGYENPIYTKKELLEFLLSSSKYLELHSDWVNSGYKIGLSPSVDGIDDYKTYSIKNIQVVTWKENRELYYDSVKSGINTKDCLPIIKMDLEGNEIEEYFSIAEAGRKNKMRGQNITRAHKKNTISGGYRWKLK